MRYTYSRWDRTQLTGEVEADDLMRALADDLLSDGDVGNALERVVRWGMQGQGGRNVMGMQSLLQQLRSARQQMLDRYSLDGLLDGVREEISSIVAAEREALDRRLAAADAEGLRASMEAVAGRKRAALDAVGPDTAQALEQLSDYEFLDEDARERFRALKDELQRQALNARFEGIRSALDAIDDAERERLAAMLEDLDAILRRHLDGQDTDFSSFMEQHGRYFPGATSLDGVVRDLQQQAAQMESLLQSLPAAMRREVDDLMAASLRHPGIAEGLARLAETLGSLNALWQQPAEYQFGGEESLPLSDALKMMRSLQNLDLLEREMKRALEEGSADGVDAELLGESLGPEARQDVERLQQATRLLEAAGYLESKEGAFELTPRGMRVIGEKALHDIFRNLDRGDFGRHPTVLPGIGGDRGDESKRYEFGDSFHLDLSQTLMNAVRRGSGAPVALTTADFEVFRTEQTVESSTVLMLDMSRSMPLRGCFVAAKKVALALNTLIRTQYPRDRLYILGFSDYARELQPEDLHRITWGDYVYGTNMQHGFMVARRLLGRHSSGTRQIIIITDGEPTAHFEGERIHFAYPPTFRTFQETLREVRRCTHEGITINTFMLERSHYLADFVNQMTRINRGRAFFATPERLGDYILVDYVSSKSARAG